MNFARDSSFSLFFFPCAFNLSSYNNVNGKCLINFCCCWVGLIISGLVEYSRENDNVQHKLIIVMIWVD